MNIGFVGLGKLGLPCAAAMSVKTGKTITGFDINKNVEKYIEYHHVPYVEDQANEYIKNSSIDFVNSIDEVVDRSDIIFVAVQTPHDEKFEGNTPITDETADFDYTYLKDAVSSINNVVSSTGKKVIIVIISTVLPGTIRREILPIVKDNSDKINVVYNPYFIAMGTTIKDFLNPEIVLLGGDNESTGILRDFYYKFIDKPILNMSYESAELVKVSYNTFIGMKIVFANTLAEITEKIGGDVDEVFTALSLSNDRIISNKYLRAGMGDGGGCHPRDQIAMSWLAKRHNLSFNLFETIAKARDSQTEYHAEVIEGFYRRDLERGVSRGIVILGESYKKNIGLRIGSPSRLLQYFLDKRNVPYTVIDPYIWKDKDISFETAKIFFVATPHDAFKNLSVPHHSIVIDPWGDTITTQYAVDRINLGRKYAGKKI